MRIALCFLPLALILALMGSGSGVKAGQVQAADQEQQPGVLMGQAVYWPISPVELPGRPSSRPAPGVRLIIHGAAQQAVQGVLTDAQGNYRLSLPPGSYRVEMGPLPPSQFTKDLPATVTITPGQETRKDILIDTGMR